MSNHPTFDEKDIGSWQFGRVGNFTDENGTGTASAVTAFSAYTAHLTGKKVVAIIAKSGTITYVVYGTYIPGISQSDFETLMNAANSDRLISIASGAVVSGGTKSAEVETTKPYTAMGATVIGDGNTYNIYFAGD